MSPSRFRSRPSHSRPRAKTQQTDLKSQRSRFPIKPAPSCLRQPFAVHASPSWVAVYKLSKQTKRQSLSCRRVSAFANSSTHFHIPTDLSCPPILRLPSGPQFQRSDSSAHNCSPLPSIHSELLQRRRSKTSCVQPGLAHPNWKTPDIRIPERRSRPRSGRDSPLGLAHLCRTQRVLPTPQRTAGQTDVSAETMLGELCGAKNSAREEEGTGAAGARRLPPRGSPWLPSLATPPNPSRSAATRRTIPS